MLRPSDFASQHGALQVPLSTLLALQALAFNFSRYGLALPREGIHHLRRSGSTLVGRLRAACLSAQSRRPQGGSGLRAQAKPERINYSVRPQAAILAGDPGLRLEGDGGTKRAELVFEVLVAPQDVLRTVHDGGAVTDQACHHQRRAPAQVRRLHYGT